MNKQVAMTEYKGENKSENEKVIEDSKETLIRLMVHYK